MVDLDTLNKLKVKKQIEQYKNYKFIVRAEFSRNGNIIPCLCQSIKPSELLPESYVLEGVYRLGDEFFPSFTCHKFHIRKENIDHIIEGEFTQEVIDEMIKHSIGDQGANKGSELPNKEPPHSDTDTQTESDTTDTSKTQNEKKQAISDKKGDTNESE